MVVKEDPDERVAPLTPRTGRRGDAVARVPIVTPESNRVTEDEDEDLGMVTYSAQELSQQRYDAAVRANTIVDLEEEEEEDTAGETRLEEEGRVDFGKYYGYKFSEVPADYVNWVRSCDPTPAMQRLLDARGPQEEYVCDFGKYDGWPLSHIPDEYVQWCETNARPSAKMRCLIRAYHNAH
eukprot:CAMPEP_0118889104 /NCGR_PEP_ID=MMETSP1166-20130328/193_1 /TAXON_ID=1104430 /ORGANISM="Chrysoreinhardia sp, Strain CCMP3193" /LENGTH=180 /DNA_ID=CAMNT_0006827691 /DNA_START=43 /DNA_END=585 /DNA_ORIENTATION=+